MIAASIAFSRLSILNPSSYKVMKLDIYSLLSNRANQLIDEGSLCYWMGLVRNSDPLRLGNS